MQFHMMSLLDFLGKIAWVRQYFLYQGTCTIAGILIRCARTESDESHQMLLVFAEAVRTIQFIYAMYVLLIYMNTMNLQRHHVISVSEVYGITCTAAGRPI